MHSLRVVIKEFLIVYKREWKALCNLSIRKRGCKHQTEHHTATEPQGLRASSLQFTSPLEFNVIFRDGFTLRLDLTAGSKIRDPAPAKFKHITNIVTCTFTML